MLSDLMLFLHENNQKLYFASLENKVYPQKICRLVFFFLPCTWKKNSINKILTVYNKSNSIHFIILLFAFHVIPSACFPFQPGIVSLQKLLVRKKAGQDSRGFYLISSNPSEPEMIELVCRTSKDHKAWMEAIREAIEMCPDEG